MCCGELVSAPFFMHRTRACASTHKRQQHQPQESERGAEIAFYPWGGALKKTNPRMSK